MRAPAWRAGERPCARARGRAGVSRGCALTGKCALEARTTDPIGKASGDASGLQDFNHISARARLWRSLRPASPPRCARGRAALNYLRARPPPIRASPRGFHPRRGTAPPLHCPFPGLGGVPEAEKPEGRGRGTETPAPCRLWAPQSPAIAMRQSDSGRSSPRAEGETATQRRALAALVAPPGGMALEQARGRGEISEGVEISASCSKTVTPPSLGK